MLKRIKKHYEIVILVCIIFYIAVLLFYNLGVQSFWIDEGYSSFVAKYMSIEGFYKSRYFLFEWLQALCFKIGGFTDFRARLPSVIAHIVSVLLMYLIPAKLCKNKYVGLFSALIFGLLYWELGWGRDARFYALIQMIMLLGMWLNLKRVETEKTIYLNLTIILTGLGIVFHPFLYCLGAILLLNILSQYNKLWDFRSLFYKRYLSTGILVIIGLVGIVVCSTLGGILNGSMGSGLSLETKKYYFSFYNGHLREQLGVMYILGIVGMVRFVVKKNIRELILFVIPMLLFFYALVVKGYLLHSRYALLVFPLMILSSVVFIFNVIKLLKTKYEKISLLLIIVLAVLFTANFQFIPIGYYYFDYTSPQPDFKLAYASIPDGKNVISGFPMLCDWYYSDRGICSYAIKVDLIGDGRTDFSKLMRDEYTNIPYLSTIEGLDAGDYYYVIDDLTDKSRYLNGELFNQLSDYGEAIYETGDSYNHIIVLNLPVYNGK